MNTRMKVTGVASVVARLNRLGDSFSGDTTYIVGTNVEYAPYVEFGTKYMAAQPFLRPARDEIRARLPEIVQRSRNLDTALHKAALELERSAKKRAAVDTGRLRASIETQKQ